MGTASSVPGARHAVPPAGITSTAWPRVEKTCRNIGWRFDPWQRAVGRLILSKRDAGGWAADLSLLSIPRQVGKSYLLGCIIFALCLLQPRLRVIWTSHHTATTEEMYEAMKELAQHKRVAPHIVKCTALQGSRWRIAFRNGSRIDFGARERGFGRGKAKVGVLVLDEFQHISMRALSNLTPTTNTAENPLILCAGTPPAPQDNGEAFRMRRKAAIEGISKDSLYVEFSADSDADLDDRKQWAKANPSFPKRTPERAFLLNRKVLDDENFRREFLGIWDEDGVNAIIPAAQWADLLDPKSRIESRHAFALDVSPNQSSAAIAVAGLRSDGLSHVEITGSGDVVDHRPGVEWVVPRLVDMAGKHLNFRVSIPAGSAAESLVPAITKAGVSVNVIKGAEVPAACGLFYTMAMSAPSTLRHVGQRELGSALAGATQMNVADNAWKWSRRKSSTDITPLYAATTALWAAHQRKPAQTVW